MVHYVLVIKVYGALNVCVWGIWYIMCFVSRVLVLCMIVSGYIVFYVNVSRVYGTLCGCV